MDSLLEFRERINSLISLIDSMDDSDEIKSHLTRYLCILMCGYIEIYIKHIITMHNKGLSEVNKPIVCTTDQIEAFINPKFEKLRQWTKKHGVKKEKFLIETASDEQVLSLNSIFKHRHWIAHGKSSDISMHTLRQYFEKAIELIPIIEQAFQL